jgi:phage terminase large subunit GpA-like protein
MPEPMDTLKSRRHQAVVFVSPARAGKTQALLDSWAAHSVTADPGDMGLYFATQTLAYDYRKRRLERLHRSSPQMRAKLSKRAHDTTIEMVVYRHGMILNLGWPSSSQLAQRDLRYVAMSDYDSFPDDIGGEGSPFELARKRIQVAMSAGMALVESSPKREITTDQWTPDGPHEAPPVAGGILQLYNRGDRRRWYWLCLDGCGERFEAPAMPLFDAHDDSQKAADSAHVCCSHCGQVYLPKDKKRLNANGVWLREGWDTTPRVSPIASFWLLGCAAAFQPWQSIVHNYLLAKREADMSGDETALKATTNTDQGMPYRPARLDSTSGVGSLDARKEDSERYLVPDGVRVLLAAVDVQSNRFEVAVWGYGRGRERWLVDRYAIAKTACGDPLRPAAVIEHWAEIENRVINSTYKLADGRELRVFRVAVDLGGYHDREKGADSSRRAYEWWRALKKDGLGNRVRLVKGERTKRAKLVAETYPDSSERSDRRSGSRGDVPVLMISADKMKNAAHADMTRETPGPGYVHLPKWISKKHMAELTTETVDSKGHWAPTRGKRNETWDLLIYCDALWNYIGGNRINWDKPPAWAAPMAHNMEAVSADQRRSLKESIATKIKRRSSSWL